MPLLIFGPLIGLVMKVVFLPVKIVLSLLRVFR